jgi:CheY-like chemotaxis protein
MDAPRVLIVDDDDLVREGLVAYLEDEGMAARGVASGEEALALLGGGGTFDVCVMDMRLPGMDGNASIRALLDRAPGLRVLIHTGSLAYSLPLDLRFRGLHKGLVFFKPLQDLSALAVAIRRLTAARRHAAHR